MPICPICNNTISSFDALDINGIIFHRSCCMIEQCAYCKACIPSLELLHEIEYKTGILHLDTYEVCCPDNVRDKNFIQRLIDERDNVVCVSCERLVSFGPETHVFGCDHVLCAACSAVGNTECLKCIDVNQYDTSMYVECMDASTCTVTDAMEDLANRIDDINL